MFRERQISFLEAEALLKRCGLHPVAKVDYRVGVFTEDEDLVATGALVGDMLQMLAVDPAYQGESLAARVVSHLVREAASQGKTCLYLFAKWASVPAFTGLGFRFVAGVPGETALLEFGKPGITEYCERLAQRRDPAATRTGCLVLNGNPFTKGHRYLVEQAAACCDRVFVLAVEEDVSEFPFAVRLELMRRGTEDLPNVTVLPGGRYAVSKLTFPAYFCRDAERSRMESHIDAELFARYLAPALGVTDRFLGEEPLSASTAVYNAALQERLPAGGVRVQVLPRLAVDGAPVSASEVRARLRDGDLAGAARLLPESTAAYVLEHGGEVQIWLAGKEKKEEQGGRYGK